MILKECYYVVYRTADYSDENKTKIHEDAYLDYTNALLVAREVAKCCDLVGDVSVVDGSTGEVTDAFDKDDVVTPAVEEKPMINEAFEDGFGGTWRRDEEDDLWSYDCTHLDCLDCAYNQGYGPCYTDKMYPDDVEEIIAEARERIGK